MAVPDQRLPVGARPPTYIAGLDGIRALAVAAVLLYHAGVPWARGGFLGVDLFFVLSGFLITSLLVAEHDRRGRIEVIAFWGRRARRLLPGVLALLAFVSCYAAFLAPPDSVAAIRSDAVATALYVANWHSILFGQGYFGQLRAPSPLMHTWSLAIEEQFYLLWPLIVLALLRLRRGRKVLAISSLAAAIGSAVAMGLLYRGGTGIDRAYYGTDTRAQDLLIGALLALLVRGVGQRQGKHLTAADRQRAHPPRPSTRTAIAAVGVGCLALLAWVMSSTSGTSPWLYEGGFFGISMVAALIIACIVIFPTGIAAKLVSVPPVAYLGRISYGLYLWHLPMFLVLDASRTGMTGIGLLGIRLSATVAAAALSFHLLEQPIRRGTWLRGWRARILVPVALGSTVVIVLIGTATTLAPEALPQGTVVSGIPASELSPGTEPVVPAGPQGAGGPLRTLLVGDSMAVTLSWGIGTAGDRLGMDVQTDGVIGCGIMTAGLVANRGIIAPEGGGLRSDGYVQCRQWPLRWLNDVRQFHPAVSVMMVGPYEVRDHFVDGRWTHIGQSSFDRAESAALQQAVDVLSSAGGKVVLLTDPYYQQPEQADGQAWPADDPGRVDTFNRLLVQVAARHRGTVDVIALGRLVSPRGHYAATVSGVTLRSSDGIHFTAAGSHWIQQWLLPKIRAFAAVGSLQVVGDRPAQPSAPSVSGASRAPAR